MGPWLDDLIADHPADNVALIDQGGATCTYGALRERVAQAASALQTHGVRPGDRVMLVSENCTSYAIAVFAICQIKAWICPVNARQSDTELCAIQSHSGARCLLFTASASDQAAAHATTFDAAPLPGLPAGLTITKCATTTPEPVDSQPDQQVAALLYTTGTTSAPKGVMLTHSNVCWNARTSANLRHLTPADLVLAVLPGSHVFGFASTFLAALHAGAQLQFIARFTPAGVLDAFAAGATALPAVPQMYAVILAHLHSTGRPFFAPNLRYTSAGGAPLDPDLKAQTEALTGLPLHNGYGLTETSPGVAATRIETPSADTSVGPPLPGVKVTIDQPDADGAGELIIQSPGVMKGYYKNPNASAAALPQPGTLRSGDLARFDANGALHLVGRLKELIIRSGFNVYPPEVEAMLTRHDDVLQAAVIGRKSGANEEILAFVLTNGGVTETGLKSWLTGRLVSYKHPQHILLVDSYPTAATGKILKHKLISHFADLLEARDQTLQKDPLV
jgi:acyl-CoA synthetase (AMP-forming)/AMP-acid ligase II